MAKTASGQDPGAVFCMLVTEGRGNLRHVAFRSIYHIPIKARDGRNVKQPFKIVVARGPFKRICAVDDDTRGAPSSGQTDRPQQTGEPIDERWYTASLTWEDFQPKPAQLNCRGPLHRMGDRRLTWSSVRVDEVDPAVLDVSDGARS